MADVAFKKRDTFNVGKVVRRALMELSYGIWRGAYIPHGVAVAYTTHMILENMLYAFPAAIPRQLFVSSKAALASVADTAIVLTYGTTLYIATSTVCLADRLFMSATETPDTDCATPDGKDVCNVFHVQSVMASRYMLLGFDMYYGSAVHQFGLKGAVKQILTAVDLPVAVKGQVEVPVMFHFVLDLPAIAAMMQ